MALPNSDEKVEQVAERSVYVVEDDIELSTVLDRVLKSIAPNVRLDWATSAEDAIKTLMAALVHGNRKPFDLIIADIFLEGRKTGMDVWRLCRMSFPDIPIVVTSGEGFGKFIESVDAHSNCPPFLHKPLSINTCRQLFQELLFPK